LLRPLLALLPVAVALTLCESASAHANLSPPLVQAHTSQLFTLAVPTEKAGETTTRIELTPPAGFAIDSFAPSPGWRRETHGRRVTWSGGAVPTGEDALFRFLAEPGDARTYAFTVRQTYSDGSVVDWSGAEAPSVEARDSLGSGGGTLTIVALALGALGLLVAAAALARAGGRELV
jgi:uncharacterized protein YcnI